MRQAHDCAIFSISLCSVKSVTETDVWPQILARVHMESLKTLQVVSKNIILAFGITAPKI